MQTIGYKILNIRSFCIKVAFSTFCLLISSVSAIAQPDATDLDNPGVDPDLIPIDGGLGFLLAAGVGYGVKKARDYRKKK